MVELRHTRPTHPAKRSLIFSVQAESNVEARAFKVAALSNLLKRGHLSSMSDADHPFKRKTRRQIPGAPPPPRRHDLVHSRARLAPGPRRRQRRQGRNRAASTAAILQAGGRRNGADECTRRAAALIQPRRVAGRQQPARHVRRRSLAAQSSLGRHRASRCLHQRTVHRTGTRRIPHGARKPFTPRCAHALPRARTARTRGCRSRYIGDCVEAGRADPCGVGFGFGFSIGGTSCDCRGHDLNSLCRATLHRRHRALVRRQYCVRCGRVAPRHLDPAGPHESHRKRQRRSRAMGRGDHRRVRRLHVRPVERTYLGRTLHELEPPLFRRLQ
jgi:hypothetical protein